MTKRCNSCNKVINPIAMGALLTVLFLQSACASTSYYDARWVCKTKITFSGYDKTETLINFPVLVKLGPGITNFSYSQFPYPANPADLRFLNEDCSSELDYEIEQWNANADYTTVNPASISGLILWLKADAGVQTNANGVYAWNDQSVMGFNATNAPGFEPAYVQDELNGKPVIRFNGVSNYLGNASWSPGFNGTAQLTYFFVSKMKFPAGGSGFFAQRASADSDYDNSAAMSLEQVGSTRYGLRYYRNGNPSIDVYRENYIFRIDVLKTDGSGTQTYLDGLPQSYSNAVFAGEMLPVEYAIGARLTTNGIVAFGQVDFAEIIIYRSSLSSNQINQVGVYLSEKYGLNTAYKRSGQSYVWVRIPALTNNTSVWAYWGNHILTNPPASTTNGSVWNANYRGVWHMGETNIHDSTINTNHGISYTNANIAGVVGDAQNFAGNAYVDLGSNQTLDITGSLTVSSWLYHNTGSGWSFAYSSGIVTGNWVCDLGLTDSNNWGGELKGRIDGPSSLLRSKAWHHQVVIYDFIAGKLLLYHDGVLVAANNASGNITSANQFKMGCKHGFGFFWNSLMDEVRVSSVAISSNWVWASWLNQASNNVFNTYGPVVKNKRGMVINVK